MDNFTQYLYVVYYLVLLEHHVYKIYVNSCQDCLFPVSL